MSIEKFYEKSSKIYSSFYGLQLHCNLQNKYLEFKFLFDISVVYYNVCPFYKLTISYNGQLKNNLNLKDILKYSKCIISY